MTLFPATTISRFWCLAKDADSEAREIFKRHYSRRKYLDGRDPKNFVGPGEKIVLITPDADALFIWRKFISLDKQSGINCSVFRNEGPCRSSEMILDAERIAWNRWPRARFYTYINARKVKSTNPGYCFIKAGWTKCGKTKKGLVILEKVPS